MLSLSEYFGRFKDNPELKTDSEEGGSGDLIREAKKTLARASELCSRAGTGTPAISSGYRPQSYNKAIGGSANSKHCFCQAIDLWDPDMVLGRWCLDNVRVLEEIGLWMESLVRTHASEDRLKRWVHLQTIAPKSGNRVFIP